MREIKFRAWDKTYKRMNYKVQVGNTDYADQNYTCNSIWVDYGDRKSIGWMNADDKCIDLMQFVGLKDKNGKEIYEGDILKTGTDKNMKVSWNNRFASFCIDRNGWAFSHWFGEGADPNDCEVIGNIYENSELLNS